MSKSKKNKEKKSDKASSPTNAQLREVIIEHQSEILYALLDLVSLKCNCERVLCAGEVVGLVGTSLQDLLDRLTDGAILTKHDPDDRFLWLEDILDYIINPPEEY